MFNFEKLFAAFLIAGLTAMLASFFADKVVHPHAIEKDAVSIDGGAIASSGPAKEKVAEPVLELIAAADVARGEKLSKACAACHSFNQGGANKVGPNLWGVLGAEKGHASGFSYSAALTEKGGKWDYEALNKFLWKPKSYIQGTKMNFAGIKKPADRAAVIAWLRTLAPAPAALPDAARIEAEKAALAPAE